MQVISQWPPLNDASQHHFALVKSEDDQEEPLQHTLLDENAAESKGKLFFYFCCAKVLSFVGETR